MNKFIALTVLLLSSVLVSADPFGVTLGGGATFSLDDDAADPDMRKIHIQMALDQNLHLLETATTICFASDDSFNIADGSVGFGMSFLCAIHECTSNAHLHTLLFGSHYTAAGYWAGAGTDASHTNVGVVNLNDGMHPDTSFNMASTLAASINLPDLAPAADAHYKCFTNFDGSYIEDNLLVDIHLDSDWEEHNVTIAAVAP
ncbi:unnamed protein product [Moneuplotes crassus]|uniref:Uncharacterized protein n=1 Tax=Euplotes crassus TaxID=5936 RepID=A0AAD2D0K8_EUPCR|nr:unnamed protein product [Moneuplotes crassus]